MHEADPYSTGPVCKHQPIKFYYNIIIFNYHYTGIVHPIIGLLCMCMHNITIITVVVFWR